MKKPFLPILALTFFITSFICSFAYHKHEYIKEITLKDSILSNIKSNYSKYVKVIRESDLYTLKDGIYEIAGAIYKNSVIELSEMDITLETKYFHIKDLDLYIEFNNVTPEKVYEVNDRYKKYIVFNKNIITKDTTTFYNEDGTEFIKINKSYDLKIIVNDKNRYGVEFYNRLLYVNKEDVAKTKNVTNTKETPRTKIRTLTYHTVYQPGKEKCTNYMICHPIEQFEKHMKYFHDNGYLTLTMEELELFLDGKIRIPKKSTVITLDDGRKLHNSIPIVEKYEVDATFFIITGENSVTDYLGKVKYAHLESHTDSLHNNYKCQGGHYGSQLLCTSYNDLVSDFKVCQEKLGGTSHYFAYPFFDANDNIIKALKATGYKLAFIGEADTDGYSSSKTDRYLLRRKTIFGNDSFEEFKSYLQ